MAVVAVGAASRPIVARRRRRGLARSWRRCGSRPAGQRQRGGRIGGRASDDTRLGQVMRIHLRELLLVPWSAALQRVVEGAGAERTGKRIGTGASVPLLAEN